MGQAESTATDNNESPRVDSQPSSVESPKDNPSMESLIAEAVAYGEEGDESVDEKAKKALECPCIAHLRTGPCGNDFSEAFLCFLKSNAEEKGSDCVQPFVMLQNCIKAHPDAFSKDVLEGDEVEKEPKPSSELKINPPRWSIESQDAKSKL
ncbi:hypothetical protein V2J09_010680 [Rumex salicifolius]